jgi:hypothetical protein
MAREQIPVLFLQRLAHINEWTSTYAWKFAKKEKISTVPSFYSFITIEMALTRARKTTNTNTATPSTKYTIK